MISIMNIRKQRKANKGITLIALVITIIVLLILAGITIASVTGEKGIIKEARTAKELSEKVALEELVELAIIKAEQKHKNPNIDNVIEELKNSKVITKESQVNKETGSIITDAGYEIVGKLDGYIEKVTGEESLIPTTIEEAKNKGRVLDENNPTTIKDTYGNEVKVPEGFKIAEDSANDVTGGVVIEDVSHGATAGSQFVWIPVGTVYTSADKSTSETITLGRYDFAEDGTPSAYSGEFIEENSQDTAHLLNYGNTIAKDIEAFKTSTTTNKGYYIGRYEARSVTERKANTNDLAQVTVEENDFVYNFVPQTQAATLARKMYSEDKTFTSDLVNSYAWDTALIFLQTFDDRENKKTPYSRVSNLYYTFASQGSNNLTDLAKQDKICNIWDMAHNGAEWSTETLNPKHEYNFEIRGGTYYEVGGDTCQRAVISNSGSQQISFRIVLYL